MKKLLITTLLSAILATEGLCQGFVLFESAELPGWITLNTPPVPNPVNPTNLPAAATWTAALLWAPGTTLGQPIGNFIQLATVSGPQNANLGYISGNTIVQIPASNSNGNEPPGATSTFLVQAWLGGYANYASAVANGALRGMSVEFTNAVGNPTFTPPDTPKVLTGWDGNLIMVPEPSTIAIGVLGAAALLLFCRQAVFGRPAIRQPIQNAIKQETELTRRGKTMKKPVFLTMILAFLTASVLAQGTIIFDSSNATGWVTLNTGPMPNIDNPTNIPVAGSWTAALLFAPGTILGQPIVNFVQVATTLGNNGYISGPTVTIPATDGEPAGAASTFVVFAWLGNYTNYAEAISQGAIGGSSVEFVNSMGNPTTSPPGVPAPMTGWDGSLIIVNIPEPSALALGALGAAAMVLLRRRK